MQHCEVCTPQHPCLYTFEASVPPSEAHLCCCINWTLAQAQHHSSLGLSQSLSSVRDGRTRPRAGLQFIVQKWTVPESSGGSMLKKPHSDTRSESHLSGRKSSGGSTSTSFSDNKKKRN